MPCPAHDRIVNPCHALVMLLSCPSHALFFNPNLKLWSKLLLLLGLIVLTLNICQCSSIRLLHFITATHFSGDSWFFGASGSSGSNSQCANTHLLRRLAFYRCSVSEHATLTDHVCSCILLWDALYEYTLLNTLQQWSLCTMYITCSVCQCRSSLPWWESPSL